MPSPTSPSASELALHSGDRWERNLAPLAEIIAQRFCAFLPLSTYPVRVGTHFNTAFGLRMAADYAGVAKDEALARFLRETGLRWYGEDSDCPAWGEPSGADFQSSALIEAECMRRLLPPEAFLPWFDRFLPRDRSGGVIQFHHVPHVLLRCFSNYADVGARMTNRRYV